MCLRITRHLPSGRLSGSLPPRKRPGGQLPALLKLALRGPTLGNAYQVVPAPSSGADSHELMECARKRCLVIKSRLNRDLDQRHAGLAHQFFSVVNAMLSQPLVSGDAERGLE